MKKRKYYYIMRLYAILILGVLLLFGSLLVFALSFVTVEKTNGEKVRCDYARKLTKDFGSHITFDRNRVSIDQIGLELLYDENMGIQILNQNGQEIYSYQKNACMKDSYTNWELIQINENGYLEEESPFFLLGVVYDDQQEYVYLLSYETNIAKVSMYLNGERFQTGKTIILPVMGILGGILSFGLLVYGLRMTQVIKKMSEAIRSIARRDYFPLRTKGYFSEVFGLLNQLEEEIRTSDNQRRQTEKTRKEWIANITHDLKTPLSPMKGYAEILAEKEGYSEEQVRKYAKVMLGNITYMEALIDDLKVTYQLENGMMPIQRENHNLVRFLREMVIEILNNPEYEERRIVFECAEETVQFSFDAKLLKRALQNLMINALMHAGEWAEINLCLKLCAGGIEIIIRDNGKGMHQEELVHLFDRYYRGTNTEEKTAGTGLGLAIAKEIIEIHKGEIMVNSEPGIGTEIKISFS